MDRSKTATTGSNAERRVSRHARTHPIHRGLRLPPDKRGRRSKPFISPEQFDSLLQFVAEPYATMLYTAVWTGLRVSELIGLKWRCIHLDSISIDQKILPRRLVSTKVSSQCSHDRGFS